MHRKTITQLRQLLDAGIDGKIEYDEIRARFEQVDVTKYGHSMPLWVPDYQFVHSMMMGILQASLSETADILELGAGTGRVTKLILEHLPNAQVTAVDNSANMLTAYQSFAPQMGQQITPIEGDFFSDQLLLPEQAFDAAVSVFAVCHGRSDADYQYLYQQIFHWLRPGGFFLCFDHVSSATNELTALAFQAWGRLLEKGFDDDTIDEIIISTIQEDFPIPLTKHLGFMEEAGFVDTDVLWRKNVFGVYYGRRP